MYISFLANFMHDPATDHAVNNLPITPAPPPGVVVADLFGASYGYHVRRPHGTRDWLLTFTLDGEGCYQLADQTYHCQVGDIFILAPGTPHDYATASPAAPWTFYWAHFIPRSSWLEWLQLPALGPGLLSQTIDDARLRQRIEQAFARLLHDSRGIGAWQAELSANALEEILLLVAQQQAQTARSLDTRIETILLHVHHCFAEPINIGALAQRVALSPSRLAHLFKTQMGISLMEMVISLRLRQAARLLEFTSLTVGEIARQVGFQSPFYFSRQFKRYYGRSPSAYRQQTQTTSNGAETA
ncbi:MAG: helix-turn-helix domain-containing protein [Caldilineaceae bacterium]